MASYLLSSRRRRTTLTHRISGHWLHSTTADCRRDKLKSLARGTAAKDCCHANVWLGLRLREREKCATCIVETCIGGL